MSDDFLSRMSINAASHGALLATTQLLAELSPKDKKHIQDKYGHDIDWLIDKNLELFDSNKQKFINAIRDNAKDETA